MGTVATNFLPNATGLNLGSSSQRWDAFIKDLDVTSPWASVLTSINGTIVFADQFAGADAGAKIQAAHDSLGSAGGIIDARAFTGAISAVATINITNPVRLILGTCTLTLAGSPGINLNVSGASIEGSSATATILATSSGTADIIQVNQVFCCGRDFGLRATVARTGGAGIRVKSSHADFRNVRMDKVYNGIQITDNAGAGYFNNISMGAGLSSSGNWNIGIYIGGVATGTVTSSAFEGCQINGDAQFATALCALYDGSDAISFTDCQFVQGGFDQVALLLDQINGGKYPEWMKFTNCYWEGGANVGAGADIVLVTKGRHVDFENCYAQGGRNGLTISTGCIDVKWIGGIIAECQNTGVLILGGTGIEIANCGIGDNSLQTNNTYDDIHVAANVTNFQIVHNFFGDILGQTPANKPTYNLNIVAGTSDFYQIIGNDFNLAATSALFNGATGTSFTIFGNTPITIANSITQPTQFNDKITKYNAIATVGSGIASQVATVDLTAQTAAGGATFYAVPASGAGQYRVSWNAKVTTAATGAATSTLGPLTLQWTDPDGTVITTTGQAAQAVAGTIVQTNATNAINSTGILLGMPVLLNCKASTNIVWAMAYASNAANTMAYNIHIKLEALG